MYAIRSYYVANPPGGISGEAETALVFVFFHGLHQPQVTFLNQIQKRYPASDITFGNTDYQAGIGFNQMRAGHFPIFNFQRQPFFFFFRGLPI